MNTIIKFFVWITILVFLLLVTLFKITDLKGALRIIGLVALIVSLLWLLFDKWLWKIKYIKAFVKRPNLNGTWTGELVPFRKEGRHIELVIKQSFTKINCVFRSQTGTNTSFSGEVMYFPDRNIKKLIFNYDYFSIDNPRNPQHSGTCYLDISENERTPNTLRGVYWTSKQRPTRGTINLTFCKKQTFDSYQGNLNCP